MGSGNCFDSCVAARRKTRGALWKYAVCDISMKTWMMPYAYMIIGNEYII